MFNLTRPQNFRLVQIKTICRRHINVHLERKIRVILGRKHCEKRRNCFSQDVFHNYISLVSQKAALCAKWVKIYFYRRCFLMTSSDFVKILSSHMVFELAEIIVRKEENVGHQFRFLVKS